MADDLPEVIICAGSPICALMGDEAVAFSKSGCPLCRHIVINPDGTETEYQKKPN